MGMDPTQLTIDPLNKDLHPLRNMLANQATTRMMLPQNYHPDSNAPRPLSSYDQLYGPDMSRNYTPPQQPPSMFADFLRQLLIGMSQMPPGQNGTGTTAPPMEVPNAPPSVVPPPSQPPPATQPPTPIHNGPSTLPPPMTLPNQPIGPTAPPPAQGGQFSPVTISHNAGDLNNFIPPQPKSTPVYTGEEGEADQNSFMDYVVDTANNPKGVIDPSKVKPFQVPQLADGQWYMPGQELAWAEAKMRQQRQNNSAAAKQAMAPFTQNNPAPINPNDPRAMGQSINQMMSK